MKKTSYHVNPAVNKWEEEQRRARMDKMIQRAKSTLPPEARGGSKNSGPKKPSPYTAENNAVKAAVRKRSTGGQGTPAGGPPVDVQELDNMIYNRVQEILGMPLMRRAAAAKPALKGQPTQKTPPSGRAGRRPAWNNEWSAQGAGSPTNHEERPVGRAGARTGAPNTPFERSPSKSSGTSARPGPAPGPAPGPTRTPSKGSRIPAPAHIDIPVSGVSLGAPPQRWTGIRAQPSEERVVLLPSPGKAGITSRGSLGPRPASSRYGSGGGVPPGAGEAGAPLGGVGGESGHVLGQSMVATIEVLNPQAPAAREAASRIAQHQQSQHAGQQSHQQIEPADALSPSARTSSGAYNAVAGSSCYGGTSGLAPKQLSGSVSVGGAAGFPGGRDRDASLMQSLTAAAGASQGGSPGTISFGGSSRRPPLAPAPRASGRGALLQGQQSSLTASGAIKGHDAAAPEEEEDAYADDDFEEYEGSDEERGRAAALQAEPGGEEKGDEEGGVGDGYGDGAADMTPDIALLRDSVNALNGLVQLRIQQELARSQQHVTQHNPPLQLQSLQGGRRQAAHPDVLASLPLVGSEDPDAADGLRLGPGRGDPANSSLGDGLRQSDLDYLARLGGGDPHEGPEVANSTDERPFVIEPGAPAGTAKAWGDRHPWAADKGSDGGAAGLQKLRERQARERQQAQPQQQEQEQQGAAFASGLRSSSQQGSGGEGRSGEAGSERVNPPPRGRGGAQAPGDEEDSVLLGDTLTPRERAGAAAQMQAVSNALAALASSGHLSPEDVQELRSQTHALYGSLVQLHDLMNGPRGAELCSASPTRASGGNSCAGCAGGTAATGFTPTALSPSDSPTQSIGRPGRAGAGAADGGAAAFAGQAKDSPSRLLLEPADAPTDGVFGLQRKSTDEARPGQGPSSHLQLTPKHQLVAEDVAWLAGLAQSLSKSLQVDRDEVDLPGM